MRFPVELTWKHGVYPKLARRDRRLADRIREKVRRWAQDGGGDWRPLRGQPEFFRLKYGDWRVILFQEPNGTVIVWRVEARGNVYD